MLPFENELKHNLSELGLLQDKKKELEDRIDTIRSGIRKWLEINNIEKYETEDDTGQPWRINISKTSRVNVNKDILPAFLTEEQMSKVLSTCTVETMKCTKVAAKSKGTLDIPSQNF